MGTCQWRSQRPVHSEDRNKGPYTDNIFKCPMYIKRQIDILYIDQSNFSLSSKPNRWWFYVNHACTHMLCRQQWWNLQIIGMWCVRKYPLFTGGPRTYLGLGESGLDPRCSALQKTYRMKILLGIQVEVTQHNRQHPEGTQVHLPIFSVWTVWLIAAPRPYLEARISWNWKRIISK